MSTLQSTSRPRPMLRSPSTTGSGASGSPPATTAALTTAAAAGTAAAGASTASDGDGDEPAMSATQRGRRDQLLAAMAVADGSSDRVRAGRGEQSGAVDGKEGGRGDAEANEETNATKNVLKKEDFEGLLKKKTPDELAKLMSIYSSEELKKEFLPASSETETDPRERLEEGINTPFCPLQKKFHNFVSRGLRNISEAP